MTADADRPDRAGDGPEVPSILFLRDEDRAAAENRAAPACFVDLNLDQVVAAITRFRGEYRLNGYFHLLLADADAVRFRQDVFRDLEAGEVRRELGLFAETMRSVRSLLAQKLDDRRLRATWILEAARAYIGGVRRLDQALSALEARSAGLTAFKRYLAEYIGSKAYLLLEGDVTSVTERLGAIRYNLRIGDGRVTVGPPGRGPDYTREIEEAFQRFRRGEARDYRAKFNVDPELSHVGILDRIALLYPETFDALDAFGDRHSSLVAPAIAAFDREVQFYLAFLGFVDQLRSKGLSFTYPRILEGAHGVLAQGIFDVALAWKLADQDKVVVPNDVELTADERVIVVTGPNQGGKTTFARAFGQLAYLAGLGCPVAGSEAEVGLADRVLTHFGREEQLGDLRGRLEDDLQRMRTILDATTPRTLLVFNEVFTSTTLVDAVFLSTEVLRLVEDLDSICLWVTFVDELAADSRTVSMVSNVLPDDPTIRTFKITRRPADGRAYAAAIAEKYGVSYAQLKDRLPT